MAKATLNGLRVTDGKVQIPEWGIWHSLVTVDGDHAISGAAEMKIADLTLKGFVLGSKPAKGRTPVRIVGGKGGWGNSIKEKAYTNDAGVRARTVLEDAARDAGESFDSSTVSLDMRLGPAWTRRAGPASETLNLIAPQGWYVGEDGTTRIGRRATSTLGENVTRARPVDFARGYVELASESIAAILPGVTVDGLQAVDVEHTISSAGGLRSSVWGRRGSLSSRGLEAFEACLDIVDPDRKFRGIFEYRIDAQEGERLNLQPVKASSGLPYLPRVFVRPGVPGCKAEMPPGAIVLVGFVNADPARPAVLALEDPEGDGFLSLALTIDATTFVKLADGVRPVGATGDLAGGIWPLAGTTRVLA